ncbi:MAG: YkgJ family cysteine cluster protein [Sphaerochaetaceae bacterium]|nr:YkgJ family cysteine cluster protein [Sphaerochaetaceae bacterium]
MAWYDKGVDFTCQRCGHCCSGEPGFVFLSEEEIETLSEFLDMSKDEFLTVYTRKIDMGDHYEISLRERADYSCIFLSDSGCMVYSVKPQQCSTYPFWSYLFSDKALWNEEMKACPGINKGEHHNREEINKTLSLEKNHKNLKIPK